MSVSSKFKPFQRTVLCGAAQPLSLSLSDESMVQEAARAAPITGSSSTAPRLRSYPNFIPLFSDELHLLQAAALRFFYRDPMCQADSVGLQ